MSSYHGVPNCNGPRCNRRSSSAKSCDTSLPILIPMSSAKPTLIDHAAPIMNPFVSGLIAPSPTSSSGGSGPCLLSRRNGCCAHGHGRSGRREEVREGDADAMVHAVVRESRCPPDELVRLSRLESAQVLRLEGRDASLIGIRRILAVGEDCLVERIHSSVLSLQCC